MDILILDDQEWTVSKLVETLREGGANVDYASSLEDALTYFCENEYQAIITDYHIDNLDGKTFLEMVRGYEVESFDDVHDPEITAVLTDSFDDMAEYRASVYDNRNARLIMFSSHEYGDGCAQDIPEDVYVAVKNNDDPTDYSAERAIAHHLELTIDEYWEPEAEQEPASDAYLSEYSTLTAMPPQTEPDMDKYRSEEDTD